jgi:ribose transport system permease protein
MDASSLSPHLSIQRNLALRRWLGFLVAAIVAAIGAAFGLWQRQPGQQVMFLAVATAALVLWGWNVLTLPVETPASTAADASGEVAKRRTVRGWLRVNRGLVIAIVGLLLGYIAVALIVDGFFTAWTVFGLAIAIAVLVFAVKVGRLFVENRSAFIGLTVLVALFVLGSALVDGFASTSNIKSMLVFAAFLGLACVGQTFVALLGGLDLSIPFVIGASNVGLLYLIGLGVPPWVAVLLAIAAGALIGFINGLLSLKLQGQALILTLGVGFAVSGLIQILTSIGSEYAGNVYGQVPGWLRNLAAMNGSTFGLPLPPVIPIWIGLAIALIWVLRRSAHGRYLYALGGNRTAASRARVSEPRYWIWAYVFSGGFSALTGCLLLGWSGGGFIGVGQPYLFMTLAAVVVGGTSLLGGYGGYGFTVIGVLVLQVLTSLLVGLGLRFEWQQFVFGLLIVPMVALYARSPHIRSQV